MAEAGEVLVTSTVAELVMGSGLDFEGRSVLGKKEYSEGTGGITLLHRTKR
jgi:hypothetical protein